MFVKDLPLAKGDLIEIKYRQWRRSGGEDELAERWVGATIIDCEDEAWPLARLSDGQLTEIRPFMTWRYISRAPDVALAA